MPFAVLFPLAGCLLLALVLFDILVTVFHPHVESPLSNRFHRVTWRVFRLFDRLAGAHADRWGILGWALPVMIPGLIVTWLAIILVAFALIYGPWIADPAAFARAETSGVQVVDALYFSGSALTTVGFGDIHPIAWPLRLVAVVEAGSGVITVSLSVAYLLSVYPQMSQKRRVAIALDAEVAGRASALPFVRRYLSPAAAQSNEIGLRLRELANEILTLAESHEAHPVLFYARPPHVRYSFLRLLVTLQNLVSLLRYGLSAEQHADIVHNPQLLLLEQTLHYSLRRLNASCHIGAVDHERSAAHWAGLGTDFDRVCDDLEALGLTSARQTVAGAVPAVVPERSGPAAPVLASGTVAATDDDTFDPALDLRTSSPATAYIAFRLATDPYISAYADATAFALVDARRDFGTAWERQAE